MPECGPVSQVSLFHAEWHAFTMQVMLKVRVAQHCHVMPTGNDAILTLGCATKTVINPCSTTFICK